MQLSVSGKHLDVGDSLRGHVSQTIAASAERYFGRAIEGNVTFQKARRAFRADISLHVARGITVQAHGEAGDPYAAFDVAAARLDKRLRRHKRRLVARRKEKDDEAAPEAAPHRVFAGDGTDETGAEGAGAEGNGAGETGAGQRDGSSPPAFGIGFSLPLSAILFGVSFGKASLKAQKAEAVIRVVAGVLLVGVGFYLLARL